MRTPKHYPHAIKRIMRPELTHCLDCQQKLQRRVTISERTIMTRKQVIRLVHCGYRCPNPACQGNDRLYRSAAADALALSGFTFGLDIVCFVGEARLHQHKTVDEIHQALLAELAPLQQTISRREILFLFEAYTALLRAGTEVAGDAQWQAQVQRNHGIILAIDGIQPDKGNETIYLLRDVLTGRILHAENVTESTTERLKVLLAPVVALQVPVLGVISDAQPTELQAVAEVWPEVPHQICQFHALRDAGRLIYNADHRVKTELRIRIQEKVHQFRQDLHKRLRNATAQPEHDAPEIAQFRLLETYAAIIEGTLNPEYHPPFAFGGLALQDALIQIQGSLERLAKKGALQAKRARHGSSDCGPS
jgi:hypothetical protein